MAVPKLLIHVIDDDAAVRDSLCELLAIEGYRVLAHGDAASFLASEARNGDLVLTDVRMPGMSGIDLLEQIRKGRFVVPVVVMSGYADIKLAVQAMKAGAADFVAKPFNAKDVLACVESAIAGAQRDDGAFDDQIRRAAMEMLAGLTQRESEVLAGLLDGKLSKTIAYELGISVRTVDKHRASLMMRTRAGSLPELIRMALLAESRDGDDLRAGAASSGTAAADPLIPPRAGRSEE